MLVMGGNLGRNVSRDKPFLTQPLALSGVHLIKLASRLIVHSWLLVTV